MTSSATEVLPVIMAGGSGTRLWPLSRAGYPKQFLVLSGTTSLFQQAATRLAALETDGLAVQSPSSSATRSTASWCSTSYASRGWSLRPSCSSRPGATPHRR